MSHEQGEHQRGRVLDWYNLDEEAVGFKIDRLTSIDDVETTLDVLCPRQMGDNQPAIDLVLKPVIDKPGALTGKTFRITAYPGSSKTIDLRVGKRMSGDDMEEQFIASYEDRAGFKMRELLINMLQLKWLTGREVRVPLGIEIVPVSDQAIEQEMDALLRGFSDE